MTNSVVNRSSKPTSRVLAWIVVAIVASAGLAYLAMQLPNRVRLLGLFSVAQGLATGVVLGYAVRALRVHSVTAVSVAAFVIGGCGIVASTWFAFDQHLAQVNKELNRSIKPGLDAAVIAQVLAAKPPENATPQELVEFHDLQKAVSQSIRPFDKEELERMKSMPGFLEHRVAAVGFNSTGATTVWLFEILAAAIACCLIARRFAGQLFCSDCDAWFRSVRAHLFSGQAIDPVAGTLGLTLTGEDGLPKPSAIYVAINKCDCEAGAVKTIVLIRRGKKVEAFDSDETLPHCQKQLIQHIDQAQGL